MDHKLNNISQKLYDYAFNPGERGEKAGGFTDGLDRMHLILSAGYFLNLIQMLWEGLDEKTAI
ncbi:MAG: hypothetical protein GX260_08475 [Tissierellia bacterium]|nr:hypothetical protein [Bacillota bacterium]NLL23783.1 hypothetical protein [Tissierellia bacterium]